MPARMALLHSHVGRGAKEVRGRDARDSLARHLVAESLNTHQRLKGGATKKDRLVLRHPLFDRDPNLGAGLGFKNQKLEPLHLVTYYQTLNEKLSYCPGQGFCARVL